TLEADCLLLCTGAWTQEWEQNLGLKLPVQPIRGQICSFNQTMTLNHMVFGNQGYLVQKGDGSIVCGASEDIAGFDTTVTDKGIGRLLKWSGKLCPQLTHAKPSHSRAGLRPATPDGRPFIGKVSHS